MKKIIVEETGEGLEYLLGEKVILLCMNYFYAGTLEGVNDKDVLLRDAHIVYETGNWSNPEWKDVQYVAEKLYVRTAAIEAYGLGK